MNIHNYRMVPLSCKLVFVNPINKFVLSTINHRIQPLIGPLSYFGPPSCRNLTYNIYIYIYIYNNNYYYYDNKNNN